MRGGGNRTAELTAECEHVGVFGQNVAEQFTDTTIFGVGADALHQETPSTVTLEVAADCNGEFRPGIVRIRREPRHSGDGSRSVKQHKSHFAVIIDLGEAREHRFRQ